MQKYCDLMDEASSICSKTMEDINLQNLSSLEQIFKEVYFYCIKERDECISKGGLMIASSYNYKAGHAIKMWKNTKVCQQEFQKENIGKVGDILKGTISPTDKEYDEIDLNLLDPILAKGER